MWEKNQFSLNVFNLLKRLCNWKDFEPWLWKRGVFIPWQTFIQQRKKLKLIFDLRLKLFCFCSKLHVADGHRIDEMFPERIVSSGVSRHASTCQTKKFVPFFSATCILRSFQNKYILTPHGVHAILKCEMARVVCAHPNLQSQIGSTI